MRSMVASCDIWHYGLDHRSLIEMDLPCQVSVYSVSTDGC
jgi:hypothetical protein